MNPKHFSFTDLMQYPAFKLAAKVDDKETMNRILWDLGLDTDKEFTIEWCVHRAVSTNIPQENYCVFGVGRTDKEWIHSGFASKEDVAMATDDKEFSKDLLSIGKEGAHTMESDFNTDNYNVKTRDIFKNIDDIMTDDLSLFEEVESDEVID